MEKDFEKLNLTENKELFQITIEDIEEIKKLNSNTSKIEKIYLPSYDKLIKFIENDEYCKIDTNIFHKFYFGSEKKIMTIDSLSSCFENFLLKTIGGLNKINFEKEIDFGLFESTEYCCITTVKDYSSYIYKNIDFLVENMKMKDFEKLEPLLESIGIFLKKNIYNFIKEKIYKINQILIVLAPGNNFWFKSEKSSIGNENYTTKLNNYNFLFMNWSFIEKFYKKIAMHSRCALGLVSSMDKKNLEKGVEGMKRGDFKLGDKLEFKFLFDKESHDQIDVENDNKKIFKRNLSKMTEKMKNEFDETNILFLESEIDKAENINHNLIPFNCYGEAMITADSDTKLIREKEIDHLFEYLEKLLNECDVDVKEYLSIYPFKNNIQ